MAKRWLVALVFALVAPTATTQNLKVQCMETQRAAAHGREHAIQHQRMEMEVEVERSAEALDHDDSPCAAATDADVARAVP